MAIPFTLDPASLELEQGRSANVTVMVERGGITSTIKVSATGELPAGIEVTPITIAADQTEGVLPVSAAASTELGEHVITIKAHSGVIDATQQLTITIIEADPEPEPDFRLTLNPETLSLSQGANEDIEVALERLGGFDGAVAVTVSGLPEGVTANAVTIAPDATSSTFTLTATDTAPTETTNVTVTGTSGTLVNTAKLALTVSKAANDNPTITAIADQTVIRNTVTANSVSVTFTVNDPDGDTLTVNATSSNPAVIADDQLQLSSASNEYTLTFTPAAAQTATADITVTADDSRGGTAQEIFTVSVQPRLVTVEAKSGEGSLRSTVTATKPGDVIGFAADVATIELASQIVLDQTLTLEGPGRDLLTIDGSGSTRIFSVDPGVTVNISGMTITGGNGVVNGGAILNEGILFIVDSAIIDNQANESGGGIFSAAGSHLTISGSLLARNIANSLVERKGGGAIFITGGVLKITDSTLSGNQAPSADGGAIVNREGSTATITGSTIGGDTPAEANVGYDGGAIYTGVLGSSLTLINTDVIGNRAIRSAGGILNFGGEQGDADTPDSTLTIKNGSLIANNTAVNTGGGIYNEGGSNLNAIFRAIVTITDSVVGNNTVNPDNDPDQPGYGGGIYNRRSGVIIIENTKISGNTTTSYGGGVYSNGFGCGQAPVLKITNSTISTNTAGTLGHVAPAGGGIAYRGVFNDEDATINTYTNNTPDNVWQIGRPTASNITPQQNVCPSPES